MSTKLQKVLGALLMAIALPVSAYDLEVGGIYYTVISVTDLTCAVTYGDKMYEGTVVIPATMEYNNRTLTVTEIEKDAFSRYGGNKNKENAIRSLTIPNTISSIPDDALYYCTSLDSLIIQDGETEIDLGRSSQYTKSYTSNYYQGPLYNTPTSYVYVGRNIKKIRYHKYSKGNNEYNYYYDQFYNSQLKVVEISDKVTSIPFFYQSEKLEKVIGGKEIAEISDSIFWGCSSLESASFPNAQTIGQDAFRYCSSLKSVSIPNARGIGYEAFFGCSSLGSVSFPNAKSIVNYAFYRCSSLESVSFPNAQTIGNCAFENCSSLESVSIPNAQTIKENAFRDCTALTQIDLPQSVKSIEAYAFLKTKITDIVIPSSKLKVLNNIFPDCIKSITLGDSIESIASGAFKKESLETINIHTVTPPTLDEDACGNAQYINVNVNVPIGSKEAYQQADVWKNFWSINEIDPTGIESITDDGSTELAFVATTGGIALLGADGQNVNVYRMTGEEVLSIKSYQGQSLSLPKGIYVIKAGKKALKVQL